MAPQTHQEGESGTESSRMMGTSSNTPATETQPHHRHHLHYHDAANAATENMNLDGQLKMDSECRSSKDKKLRAIGCEYSRIEVDAGQPLIYHQVGVLRELRDHIIPARDGKPPWSTIAFGRTVHEIEHHDVISSGIFGDKFITKNPREWTTQASTTLEDATEASMVEVLAKTDM